LLIKPRFPSIAF